MSKLQLNLMVLCVECGGEMQATVYERDGGSIICTKACGCKKGMTTLEAYQQGRTYGFVEGYKSGREDADRMNEDWNKGDSWGKGYDVGYKDGESDGYDRGLARRALGEER